MIIDVRGTCPACGRKALHVVRGAGIVHCLAPECPNPSAAHNLLEPQPRPAPIAGKTWRYRSPADGAEVLVRFNGTEWQTADPHLPTRWYSCGAELLEWPGIFTELETGLPR